MTTLWWWTLRNWRALSLLVAATVALLAAGLLPGFVRPWAQAAIWGAALVVVLTRNDSISTLTREDATFVERYDGHLKRMADLKSRALSTEPAAYVAQLEKIVAAIETLEAPSREWANLKAQTVAELRRRLAMMRFGQAPSTEDLNHAEERWSTIEREFRRILRAKSRFRKHWPARSIE